MFTNNANCQRFKQEKESYSALIHCRYMWEGLRCLSPSLKKIKGRVIWTEKRGLTFHFLYQLSFRAQQTHRVRPLAVLVYRKNRAKETIFLRQKNRSKKKLNGNFDLSKSFLRCIFVKTATLKKRLWVCFLFCNGCR